MGVSRALGVRTPAPRSVSRCARNRPMTPASRSARSSRHGLPRVSCANRKQQTERVTVGGDGVGAGVAAITCVGFDRVGHQPALHVQANLPRQVGASSSGVMSLGGAGRHEDRWPCPPSIDGDGEAGPRGTSSDDLPVRSVRPDPHLISEKLRGEGNRAKLGSSLRVWPQGADPVPGPQGTVGLGVRSSIRLRTVPPLVRNGPRRREADWSPGSRRRPRRNGTRQRRTP